MFNRMNSYSEGNALSPSGVTLGRANLEGRDISACADLEGGGGGMGSGPPWNLQSLISPILLEMKKLYIFHICALPQLYDKQNQSYLRLDPPGKKFLDPRLLRALMGMF